MAAPERKMPRPLPPAPRPPKPGHTKEVKEEVRSLSVEVTWGGVRRRLFSSPVSYGVNAAVVLQEHGSGRRDSQRRLWGPLHSPGC